jgi:hypothetical protein
VPVGDRLEKSPISGTIEQLRKTRILSSEVSQSAFKKLKQESLPIRLMVGLWFLVPAIGVRVPDRQRESFSFIYQYIFGSSH